MVGTDREGREREGEEVQTLKEWRIRRYWSYQRLAKEAHVSTETLQRAERGGHLHDITERKIADALGIRVSQVVEFAARSQDAGPGRNSAG